MKTTGFIRSIRYNRRAISNCLVFLGCNLIFQGERVGEGRGLQSDGSFDMKSQFQYVKLPETKGGKIDSNFANKKMEKAIKYKRVILLGQEV